MNTEDNKINYCNCTKPWGVSGACVMCGKPINIIGKIVDVNVKKIDQSLIENNNESSPTKTFGDLVPLIWLIEKLRRREGGCIMNELIAEIEKNFKGLENIKHRTIEYK